MYLDRFAGFQFPNNLYLLSVTSISYILSAVSKILPNEDRFRSFKLEVDGCRGLKNRSPKQSNFTFICQQGKRNNNLEKQAD